MEKTLYDNIVRFLREGTYPTGDFHSRFVLKRCAQKYTLYGRRLRQGSLVVLHEEEAFDVLSSLHLRKQHIRGPSFLAAVKKEFVVNRAWTLCCDVVRCCAECTGTYTYCREGGPLVHYSIRQRKGLCQKIGIPFVRDLGLENAPELDPLKFRPRTVDMAGPRNCFCIVLSYVLSGTCQNVAAVEEWVKKIRRGPHSSLYRTFDAIVPDSLDDVSYLTRTDIRIIARELGINLYEYFASTNKRPARWEVYSGNKKGADRGGVYFAFTLKNGRGHSLLVRGLEPISE